MSEWGLVGNILNLFGTKSTLKPVSSEHVVTFTLQKKRKKMSKTIQGVGWVSSTPECWRCSQCWTMHQLQRHLMLKRLQWSIPSSSPHLTPAYGDTHSSGSLPRPMAHGPLPGAVRMQPNRVLRSTLWPSLSVTIWDESRNRLSHHRPGTFPPACVVWAKLLLCAKP